MSVTFLTNEDEKRFVKTVNGKTPDVNGNVTVYGGSVDGSGEPGADGFSPIANVTQTDSGAVISITDKSGTTTTTITNGKDGVDGQPGKDGTSATHSWNGTTLTVTSASGTSSANLKGDKGDKGDTGGSGSDGVSPTVAVSKSGKVTTVSITDKNGTKTATINDGADGKDGSDGFATITETELATLTQEILAEMYADGVRVLAVSADENLVPVSISQNGVVYNGCGYMNNYRLNSSGGTQEALSAVLTGFMPYTYGKTIEIAGGSNPANAGGQYIATYDSNFALIGVNYLSTLISNSGGGSVCTENNEFIHTVKTSSFGASSNTNLFKTAAYIRVCLCPCVGSRLRVRYI